jgi:hypothetical protein
MRVRLAEQGIDQSGFAVVHVGDDGDVTDVGPTSMGSASNAWLEIGNCVLGHESIGSSFQKKDALVKASLHYIRKLPAEQGRFSRFCG